MIEDLVEMAKDEEGRKELIDLLVHLKGELMPLVSLGIEVFGEDADNVVDSVLKWQAKKSKVLYNAYIAEGFTSGEAMALIINAKAELGSFVANLR